VYKITVIQISLPIIIYEYITVIDIIGTMSVQFMSIMLGLLSVGYRQIEPKVDVKHLLLHVWWCLCVQCFLDGFSMQHDPAEKLLF
jgi:hypothetical protein